MMSVTTTFEDQKGRIWDLKLNAPKIKEIERVYGIRLTALEKDPINSLAADPVLLIDVVYLVCEQQCQGRNISSEEFGTYLPPEIDVVAMALKEAIINFFPQGKRSAIRRLLEANQKVQDRTIEALVAKLEAPELANLIQDKVNRSLDLNKMIEGLTEDINGENTSSSRTTG